MTEPIETGIDAALASRLAHEVRSPLGVIIGALEQVAEEQPESGLAAQLVKLARRSCARLDRLTRRLDRLGDTPSNETEGAPVALDALVEKSVARVRRELRRAKVEVHLDSSGADHSIRAPAALALEVALDEVVHNALAHARSQVRVAVQADDERLLVEVHDDGGGLPAEVARRHPTCHTDSKRGLGLGLLTAHRWCQAVGGALALHASEEGGYVSITIPTRTKS